MDKKQGGATFREVWSALGGVRAILAVVAKYFRLFCWDLVDTCYGINYIKWWKR